MSEHERVKALLAKTLGELRAVNWPEAVSAGSLDEVEAVRAPETNPPITVRRLNEVLDFEVGEGHGDHLITFGEDKFRWSYVGLRMGYSGTDRGPVLELEPSDEAAALTGYHRYDGTSERIYVEDFEELPVYGGEEGVEPFAIAPLYLDCELGRYFYYEQEARDLGALTTRESVLVVGAAERDELCCPTCHRPHVLHGIECPTLSTASAEEAFQGAPLQPGQPGDLPTIYGSAERLLQESRHVLSETIKAMKRPRCASYEGCGGRGYLDDPQDSGSGRTVYCDCAAGVELGERESRGDDDEFRRRRDLSAERYTRDDGSQR